MIYLAHTAAGADEVLAQGLADDVIALTAGLLAIDTDLTRSRLYHGLKRLQDDGAPLLVTQLAEPPKLKAMAPGAVAWFRRRLD